MRPSKQVKTVELGNSNSINAMFAQFLCHFADEHVSYILAIVSVLVFTLIKRVSFDAFVTAVTPSNCRPGAESENAEGVK